MKISAVIRFQIIKKPIQLRFPGVEESRREDRCSRSATNLWRFRGEIINNTGNFNNLKISCALLCPWILRLGLTLPRLRTSSCTRYVCRESLLERR